MPHNIQPLRRVSIARTEAPEKSQEYTCVACGIRFMSYPGQLNDWPEPGQGLPPCCGDHDCSDYLQDLSIMRGWMAQGGSFTFQATDGHRYHLSGHEALARRVSERRQMVEEGYRRSGGW